MKRRILPILLIIAMVAELRADTPSDLPPVARDLADKLSAWEAQKRDALEQEIQAKRNELVTLMKVQLQNETKQGNLDGALAIQKFIQSLQTGEIVEDDKGTETAMTSEQQPLSLANTKWKTVILGLGTQSLVFDRKGNLVRNGIEEIDYEIVMVPTEDHRLSFTVADRNLEFTIQMKEGEPFALLKGATVYFKRDD